MSAPFVARSFFPPSQTVASRENEVYSRPFYLLNGLFALRNILLCVFLFHGRANCPFSFS